MKPSTWASWKKSNPGNQWKSYTLIKIALGLQNRLGKLFIIQPQKNLINSFHFQPVFWEQKSKSNQKGGRNEVGSWGCFPAVSVLNNLVWIVVKYKNKWYSAMNLNPQYQFLRMLFCLTTQWSITFRNWISLLKSPKGNWHMMCYLQVILFL